MIHRSVRRHASKLLVLVAACTSEPRTPPDAAPAAPAIAQIPGPSATPVRSPEVFRVLFETSKGDVTIEVKRALAPLGADRFYELGQVGYFTDVRFFRLVPGFVVQFGIHGTPAVNDLWANAVLPDEPMRERNVRGTVAFTTAGANTRSNQLFINTGDNRAKLDGQRLFAPIGYVVDGMDVVDRLNTEYGEEPNQSRIAAKGNEYLGKWFPALDYIKSATIVPPPA